MLQRSIDSTKKLVASVLNFYEVGMVEESMGPRSPDTVDVVACISGGGFPDLAVKLFEGRPRLSEYYGALNNPNFKYIFFLAPANLVSEVRNRLPASTSLLEKEVFVFPLPSSENTEMEDKVREFTRNKSGLSYFQRKTKDSTEIAVDTQELDRFREQISGQGLSVDVAKRLVYQTAVGGLSIESGTKMRHSLGKMITRRNENLSREAIFLEALGILQESDRTYDSSLVDEGKLYLTLDQREGTTRLATQVIAETLEFRRDDIVDLLSSYPAPFTFVVLIGSLGIFAPKQMLPPERAASYKLGVIRTTFESENTHLVDTIRELVNTADISTIEWNRINTLASYGEISNLLHQFYERFEKIGIGVKGHRGIKRIYLPVTHIARVFEFSSLKESYNKAELKRFSIWDAVLNYRSYQHNWGQRLESLGLNGEDISWALSFTMERKMTSGLLPEDSFMPFAVYNSHGFRNFCLERMRQSASAILDITW